MMLAVTDTRNNACLAKHGGHSIPLSLYIYIFQFFFGIESIDDGTAFHLSW